MECKIREAREARKMTQEELSKKSGISRTTISGLETGVERATSTKTLLAIAKALEVSVAELFFEDSVYSLNTVKR